MSGGLSHADIAERFLESGAIDFERVGRFVGDMGPALANDDDGLHGVLIGKLSTIACVLTADMLEKVLVGPRFVNVATALDVPIEK